jgi:hypothetical protein
MKAIVETGTSFMVVKIRFGRGPVVTRRKGKNSRIATLAASVLTLVSLSCASLGMWRIGTDLGWAGDFVFPQGFLSHWQVWAGAAVAIQYSAWKLTRYARIYTPDVEEVVTPSGTESQEPVSAAVNV